MQHVYYQRVLWLALAFSGCASRLGGVAGHMDAALAGGNLWNHMLVIFGYFVKNGDDRVEISLGLRYPIH